MIIVFSATDKAYSSNGDIVFKPTKARVHNKDNGDFYLELICGVEYNKYIASNNIILLTTLTISLLPLHNNRDAM